jgi:hypothetical protein
VAFEVLERHMGILERAVVWGQELVTVPGYPTRNKMRVIQDRNMGEKQPFAILDFI